MPLVAETAYDWCVWAQGEQREGRADRAQAGYRRALAIEPASMPALFGLASLLLDTGNIEGAAAMTGQMVAIAAGRPETLWLQARVAITRGNAEMARERLTKLLDDPLLQAAQRAEALLMLGLALGDLGQCEAAFDAARRGKHLQRGLYAAQSREREPEVAKLDRLSVWLGDTADEWRSLPRFPAADASPSHVFLLGFPRSGTTLLEQVLAAHPRVSTLEEEPTLATAYQAFLSDDDACAALMRLGPEEAAAWVDHYWTAVRRRGVNAGTGLFVDKQPAGTLYLPIIARLFPNARILFAVRDPRDVVLSCFRQAFQMNAMTYAFTDLAETAACYASCMAFAEHARSCLPLAWTDVRHESLVEDFTGELDRLLGFLELEADPSMLDFVRSANARMIRTPSATQVRAGLNRRGLGRWERYRSALAPVMPILAPWVGRFGYLS